MKSSGKHGVRFGPNRTAKQKYIRFLLTATCIVVLTITCTFLLFKLNPNLEQTIQKFIFPSSSSSSLTSSSISHQPYHAANNSNDLEDIITVHPSKLSDRNDLDPYPFEPVDPSLPDDLFPSSTPSSFKSCHNLSTSTTTGPDASNDDDDDNEDNRHDDSAISSVVLEHKYRDHEENPNLVVGEVTKVEDVKIRRIDYLKGEDVIVNTKLGKVKGIQGDVLEHKVNAFLGIPYTENVMIKENRFLRSNVRTKKWSGILTANKFKPHCPQVFHTEVIEKRTVLLNEMSEDCLYLNIWTPGDSIQRSSSSFSSSDNSVNRRKRSALKPVMIWIFGGGFSGGSNNLDEMDGRMLAALGDVIVVNLNYRVGSFGFLDMGIDASPGNMGLYDILSGIKFVHQNIESFGGDNSKITLFGQSAGAIAIGLLMTSNHTSQYFHRAIMESGSPVMLNFFFTRSEESANKFVKVMGCEFQEESNSNDTETESRLMRPGIRTSRSNNENWTPEEEKAYEVFSRKREKEVKCLMGKTTSEILVGQKRMLNVAFPFTPTPYEDLIPIMPFDALNADEGSDQQRDTFNHIQDVLIGSNADEASVILHLEIPEVFGAQELHVNFTTLNELRAFLIHNLSKEFGIDATTSNLFTNLFFSRGPEKDTTINFVRRLYKVIGDLAFVCPVVSFAEGLTHRNKNVFQYEFNYRNSASPWGKWMGVTHGDEYIFTFGHPLRYPERYSQDDIDMSRRMIHNWSSFAKTGTIPPQVNKKWPKFTLEKGEYMKIKKDSAAIGHKIDEEVCSLFSVGLDALGDKRRRKRASIAQQVQQIMSQFAKFSLA